MTAVVASPPQIWQPQGASQSLIDERLQKFRSAIPQLSELLSEDKIKAHLALMAAFTSLFREVAGPDVSSFDYRGTPALTSFLKRSVYRFLLWLDTIVEQSEERQSIQDHELPPLDVAALLHAFVLAPFEYFEDCLIKFPKLYASGPFPLLQLAKLVNPETCTYNPSAEQIAFWEERTGVPFDPFEHSKLATTHLISCPFCAQQVAVLWDDHGKGFGEAAFSSTCDKCGRQITDDALRTAKFCKDLQSVVDTPDGVIAGTILDISGQVNYARARIISLEVVKVLCMTRDGELPTAGNSSMANIYEDLKNSQGSKLRKDRIEALLRPYSQPSRLSLNLVRGICVMLEFNAKFEKPGWFDPAFLSEHRVELDNARTRFYSFLELVLFPENGAISASSDVDLVWHTMQLEGPIYRNLTIALLGAYIDHIPYLDEPETFNVSIIKTAERWQEMRKDTFSIPLDTWRKPSNPHAHGYADGEGGGSGGGGGGGGGGKPKPPDPEPAPKPACGVSVSQIFLVDDLLEI